MCIVWSTVLEVYISANVQYMSLDPHLSADIRESWVEPVLYVPVDGPEGGPGLCGQVEEDGPHPHHQHHVVEAHPIVHILLLKLRLPATHASYTVNKSSKGKIVLLYHRRRIKTEEKAKVLAAAWGEGAELIKFLAKLAILHQDDLKNRMNCTRTIWRIGWIALRRYEE